MKIIAVIDIRDPKAGGSVKRALTDFVYQQKDKIEGAMFYEVANGDQAESSLDALQAHMRVLGMANN